MQTKTLLEQLSKSARFCEDGSVIIILPDATSFAEIFALLKKKAVAESCNHNWQFYDYWDIVPMEKCDNCGLFKEQA